MRIPLMAAALAALFLSGGAGPAPTDELGRALPWLRDFPATAATAAPSREAEAWLRDWRSPPDDCATTSDAGFALAAELLPAVPGLETVLASYTAGVVVLDARGRRVASTPPLSCRGSVDAIEGIAVGELLRGEPVIALAATSGGRAERTTWLLFLAPRGEALAPIFAVPVEEHRGPAVATGEVTRLPGGALRYRSPRGAISRWTYDPAAGRYVMREELRPEPPPGATVGPAA
ncbi:MAG TPA: hypothetical protein VK932_05750 [Kofleriaceae bacterium]|nr:hypothetical protein [Kofleriaceae bacterium]